MFNLFKKQAKVYSKEANIQIRAECKNSARVKVTIFADGKVKGIETLTIEEDKRTSFSVNIFLNDPSSIAVQYEDYGSRVQFTAYVSVYDKEAWI